MTEVKLREVKDFVYDQDYGYDCEDPSIVYWCCCNCRTKNPDFIKVCTCCKKENCGKCNYPWVDWPLVFRSWFQVMPSLQLFSLFIITLPSPYIIRMLSVVYETCRPDTSRSMEVLWGKTWMCELGRHFAAKLAVSETGASWESIKANHFCIYSVVTVWRKGFLPCIYAQRLDYLRKHAYGAS